MIYYLEEGFFDKLKDIKKKHEEEKANKKHEEEEKRNAEIDEEMDKNYENYKKYIKNPYSLGDGYDEEILILASKLKYPITKLVSAYRSSSKIVKCKPRHIFSEVTDDILKKLHCTAEDNLLVILENDDYLLLLNPSNNFLETDCRNDVFSYGKSFYTFDNYKGDGMAYDSDDWSRFMKRHNL